MVSLPRSNLKGLAYNGMLRAASHQPRENWGPVLSFLWKSTIHLYRCPWPKLILLQKYFLYARVLPDCPNRELWLALSSGGDLSSQGSIAERISTGLTTGTSMSLSSKNLRSSPDHMCLFSSLGVVRMKY